MLTQYDVDKLMQEIQENGSCKLYYTAHLVETREGFLDEYIYKSVPKFKVIELECTGFNNALFERFNFADHPENYHTEEEICFYDINSKYIHYYTSPNTQESYTELFNSRMPSIVYGVRRKYYKNGEFVKEYNDPSPIKEVYVNALEYGDYTRAQSNSAFEANKLDWKYKKLENKEDVDGVLYDYVTSDWYILDINNFPRVEKPLINTNQKTAYFTSHEAAEFAIQQLNA